MCSVRLEGIYDKLVLPLVKRKVMRLLGGLVTVVVCIGNGYGKPEL